MIYDKVLDFVRFLFEPADPGRFQRSFLEALLRVQNVSRGSLWVRREGELECIEAAGEQSDQVLGVRLPADRPSVVGWVMENSRMTIAEPEKDPRHCKDVEADLEVKSTLILCFPLVLLDGSVYGAVELIDVSSGGDRLNLDPGYLELLGALVAIGSAALGRALDFDRQTRECHDLRRALEDLRHSGHPIVGRSRGVAEAEALATAYGRTDFPVLITGESGTGKELFAHAIHQASRRRDKPFLVQNCSAIPEALLESELFGCRKGAFTGADRDRLGLFQAADGGTVFLDEIGDMPPPLQAKILRLIQSGEVKPLGAQTARSVDVRLVSATNKDLALAMERGEFREDLFYRLNVLPLALPPLRARRDDIPELLDYFVRRDCKRLGAPAKRFSPAALARLTAASWKGNIREMENLVKYLLTVVPDDVVDVTHLPAHVAGEAADLEPAASASAGPALDGPRGAIVSPELPEGEREGHAVVLRDHTWEALEKAYITDLLESVKWNISKAAKLAGVNRSTFDSRLRKLGLSKA
ncbi:hypothetical protein JCM15519_33900 [Fundidesulfovibrio butyratiphilus]